MLSNVWLKEWTPIPRRPRKGAILKSVKVIVTAVVGLTAVAGLLAGAYWYRAQPHETAHGTWIVQPNNDLYYEFDLSGKASIRVEVAVEGVVEVPYSIQLVDEATKPKLESSMIDADKVPKIFSQDATGPLTIGPTVLAGGTYYIILENTGPKPVTLKYQMFESAAH